MNVNHPGYARQNPIDHLFLAVCWLIGAAAGCALMLSLVRWPGPVEFAFAMGMATGIVGALAAGLSIVALAGMGTEGGP